VQKKHHLLCVVLRLFHFVLEVFGEHPAILIWINFLQAQINFKTPFRKQFPTIKLADSVRSFSFKNMSKYFKINWKKWGLRNDFLNKAIEIKTHLNVGGRLNKSVHHLLTNGAVDNVA
jgi:hypothetical protein